MTRKLKSILCVVLFSYKIIDYFSWSGNIFLLLIAQHLCYK